MNIVPSSYQELPCRDNPTFDKPVQERLLAADPDNLGQPAVISMGCFLNFMWFDTDGHYVFCVKTPRQKKWRVRSATPTNAVTVPFAAFRRGVETRALVTLLSAGQGGAT
jgi:hypothetical protein